MFEELINNPGTVRIPTGVYVDSVPTYADSAMTYFRFPKGVRNPATGLLQSEDTFLIKSDTLTEIPADSKIVDKSGAAYDISVAMALPNFDGGIECFKVVVAHG